MSVAGITRNCLCLGLLPVVSAIGIGCARPEQVETGPGPAVAVLGKGASLAVDGRGVVVRRSGGKGLPAIVGYGGRLRLGHVPSRECLAAAQVLGETGQFGLAVASVDVSAVSFLLLSLENGTQVRLAWLGMGEDTEASRDRLRVRLGRVSAVVHSRKGSLLERFDATQEGRVRGVNVIPPDAGAANPEWKRVHVAERGDDLYGISLMWGVPVSELKKLNNLTSVAVEPGQLIEIPPSN